MADEQEQSKGIKVIKMDIRKRVSDADRLDGKKGEIVQSIYLYTVPASKELVEGTLEYEQHFGPFGNVKKMSAALESTMLQLRRLVGDEAGNLSYSELKDEVNNRYPDQPDLYNSTIMKQWNTFIDQADRGKIIFEGLEQYLTESHDNLKADLFASDYADELLKTLASHPSIQNISRNNIIDIFDEKGVDLKLERRAKREQMENKKNTNSTALINGKIGVRQIALYCFYSERKINAINQDSFAKQYGYIAPTSGLNLSRQLQQVRNRNNRLNHRNASSDIQFVLKNFKFTPEQRKVAEADLAAIEKLRN